MNTRIEDPSLDKKLHSLDINSLRNLIHYLRMENPRVYISILEWFKMNVNKIKVNHEKNDIIFLSDTLLMEYWENARKIISEFNEYGGGPEEDEDKVIDWLYKISTLNREGNTSTGAKFRFLDDAFIEYAIGNSGFDDALMEIFFDICKTKQEWEYLVKKLNEFPSDWTKKLSVDIRKKYLHDDKLDVK